MNRAILLLHGGPGLDDSYFFPYLKPLERWGRLITYRQGKSGACTMEELVAELDAVLAPFGGMELVLLGHSFGAALAVELAKSRPSLNVRKLVLVGPALHSRMFLTFGSKLPAATRKSIDEKLARLNESDPQYLKESMRAWCPAYFTSEKQSEGMALIEKMRYDAKLYLGLQPYLSAFDLESWLARANLSTLVVYGSDEQAVLPEYCRSLGALSPSIKLAEIEGAGHFPFVERPKEFVEVVERFLA